MERQKHSASVAVPLPDSAVSAASMAPIPAPAISNKPAPGQKGPKGLAPRTNYSRVNTGAPPIADVAAQQKALPPDPMGTLSHKIAQLEVTSMPQAIPRFTIQEMIKSAAEGAASSAAITREAIRQLLPQQEDAPVKVAAPTVDNNGVSTVYVDKLAAAVEYIVEQEKLASEGQGPGQGPNAHGVLEAQSSEENVDAGEMGQALQAHQPPMNPPMQIDPSRAADPGTGLETNDDMMHPEQPDAPAKVSSVRSFARRGKELVTGSRIRRFENDLKDLKAERSKRYGSAATTAAGAAAGGATAGLIAKLDRDRDKGRNKKASASSKVKSLARRGKELVTGSKIKRFKTDLKAHEGTLPHAIRSKMQQDLKSERLKRYGVLGLGGATGGATAGLLAARDKNKEASSVDPRLVDALLAFKKQAEDAINPAQISAGPEVPPGTSAAGEPGGAPAGGLPQGSTSLVESNEAAINYTKGEAKAKSKADLRKVLTEPAMSASTDSTLQKTLDSTDQAGAKISSAIKTAAARALLEKLAQEAESKQQQAKA